MPTWTRSSVREKIELRQAIVETETSEFEKMVEEAVVLHKAGRFEAAVEKNIDLVACLEANAKKGSTAVNAEVHAMAVHNLGSALHQTGQFDVAKAFYSEAVTELSTAEQGPLDFILKMFGDVRGAQLEFMKHKISLATSKTIPKATVFLNGNGEEEEWSAEEIARAQEQADAIEKRDAERRKKVETPAGLPTLNMSLAANVGTSYPITSTPRKELW